MKLPDFKSIDWKMLLLEKGQYGLVGLGAVIGGSLLFYSLASGVTAPSPSSNEEKLAKENTRVKSAQAAATPDKSNAGPDGDVPPPKVDMTFSQGKAIDALAYMAGEPLLIPEDPAEIKRKMPKILTPVESRVAFARVPLRSASFNDDFTQVLMIGDASGSGSGGPGGGFPGGGMGPGGAGGPGGMGGGIRGGMPGGMAGANGGNNFLAQFAPRANTKMKDRYEEDPRKSLGSSMRNYGDLMSGKLGNAKFAEQALPLRMAVIAATFPYQAQLKEFQRKLKHPNIQTVLYETSANLDPRTGQPYPAFRFLRVELQRRTQQPDGAFGEWTNVELEKSFRNYVNFTLGRTEAEDDLMGLISFPGLVMPKLLTFYSSTDPQVPSLAGAGGPGGAPKSGVGDGGAGGVQKVVKPAGLAGQPQLYPEPEKGLEKLNKMLNDYKDRKQQFINSLYQTKPKYDTNGSLDIFSPGANNAGGPGMSPPGGGAPGMGDEGMATGMGAAGMRPGAGGFPGGAGGRSPGGFPGAGPGGGIQGAMPGGFPGGISGGFQGGGGGGGFKGGGPGGVAGGPGAFGGPGGFPGGTAPFSANLTSADLPSVEYALVRVFDPTVQPGEIYQYRMRIVMSNPNFGRQDVASTSYSKEKEIVGEDWYQVPGTYAAPSDLSCYVNDTKASDPNRLNLEVYKWAAGIKSKAGTEILLGDWLKSTVSVGKGEMVGRNSKVTLVPYWRYDVDGYSFVPVERTGGPNSKKGVDVEFKPNSVGEQGDYLLVDFDGPNARYEKITLQNDVLVRTPITDEHVGVEAVLQGADNRLILRSSITDKDDQDKKTLDSLIERHKSVSQNSINAAKMGHRPGGGGGPGGGGPGGGGGADAGR